MASPDGEDGDVNYLFKVVVVGDSGVGKSNIILRYTRDEFREAARTTIGVEFASKKVETAPGVFAHMQLWDTAGQERYKAVTKSYYRKATGCFFVYDITSRSSFANLKRWMDEVLAYVENDKLVLGLIGNKSDLAHARAVSVEEAATFARIHNMTFFETSARDSQNIEQAFQGIVKEMYKISHQSALGSDGPQIAPGKGVLVIPPKEPAGSGGVKKDSCCVLL
eukprot:TRINITY_DN13968_c0_g1_i1.p1 TRINITY_DN13968_c0_g1~~TRINITY_DN13968_c0_g1_i1.p1  ORF type:complete len:223 (+),score=40.27 TRINITY_DN13968_c0_g1_i1:79-747(+)